jgi:hypothetical protein
VPAETLPKFEKQLITLMPWPGLAQLEDSDLEAIYSYLMFNDWWRTTSCISLLCTGRRCRRRRDNRTGELTYGLIGVCARVPVRWSRDAR